MEPISYPCYLSDRNGTALNPYAPDSIRYKNLSGTDDYGEQPVLDQLGEIRTCATAAVLLEGYITLCVCAGRLLRTVPFRSMRTVLLPFQPSGPLAFRTVGLSCKAAGVCVPDNPLADDAEITIHVESGVSLAGDPDGQSPSTVFKSCICFPCCLPPLHFRTHQYQATGDGTRRVYTNADQNLSYGCTEIPDPGSVSFYRLFVNGVLQPEAVYALKRGRLEFLTENVPPAGAPITLFYAELTCRNRRMTVESSYYVTASDGVRSLYTDGDAWFPYGSVGIPAPREVSCWNLYVNGVLQPQATYQMEKGLLRLCAAPQKGAPIVLELMRVQEPSGRLLSGLVLQYVAYAKGRHLFTDRDAAEIYDSSRIILPPFSSYQNVYVNSVVQPRLVYRVRDDRLVFVSTDAPAVGQPVTQQSTGIFL